MFFELIICRVTGDLTRKGKGSMYTGGNAGDASMDAFVRDTKQPMLEISPMDTIVCVRSRAY